MGARVRAQFEPVPELPGLGGGAVAPQPGQPGELTRPHVRRGQDRAVGAEREQRGDVEVIAAEDAEAGRPASHHRDRILVDRPGRVLHAGDAGHLGEPPHGRPAHGLPGAIRNVIDEQRNGAASGQCPEMLEHSGLARTAVVRHHRQRGADLLIPGQAGQRR